MELFISCRGNKHFRLLDIYFLSIYRKHMYVSIYVIVTNLGTKFRIATFTMMNYLGGHFTLENGNQNFSFALLICQLNLNYWQMNSNAY